MPDHTALSDGRETHLHFDRRGANENAPLGVFDVSCADPVLNAERKLELILFRKERVTPIVDAGGDIHNHTELAALV